MIHAKPFYIKASLGEPIHLRMLGDIHHLLQDSDEDRLISDLRNRPGDKTYFLDMGDACDAIAPAHKYFSLHRIKNKFKIQDAPLLDAELQDLAGIISEWTSPEEWIGHLSGNHPLFLLNNGLDICQNLCSLLGHRYLGYSAFIPVVLTFGKGKEYSLMILAHHGFGGGGARTEGAAITAYTNHARNYTGWRIAVYGHRHQKGIWPLSVISPHVNLRTGERWIKDEERYLCLSGSYLRTLSDSEYPSYSEKGGMNPRSLGCVTLSFKISRESGHEGAEQSYTLRFLNL